jgi:hypothetical protein
MRRLNSFGLYSKGAEKASELPEGSFPAQQLIASLLNKGGISKDELQNAGMIDENNKPHPEWVKRGKINKQDLIEHLHNSVPQISEAIRHQDPTREINELSKSTNALEGNMKFYSEGSPERQEREQILQERRAKLAELQHIKETRVPDKFGNFTLPYQKNYREVLLKLSRGKTLPNGYKVEYEEPSWPSPTVKGTYFIRRPDGSTNRAAWRTPEAAIENELSKTDFKSQHWDDPNVLAHIRMSDRLGPRGEKILHVEELQSDWGQQGRKEGFRNENDKKFNDLLNKKDAAEIGSPEYEAAQNELNAFSKTTGVGVPDAPYVNKTAAWTDLALKRVLHEAAKGGYDHIVWTPGQQHVNRYGLRNHVDELHYDRAEKKFSYLPKDSMHLEDYHEKVQPHELGKIIGQEAADKLLSAPTIGGVHYLGSQNLEFGGEGMKAYYDKMVPTRLQKLAQEHDPQAKVGPSAFKLPPDTERGDPDEPVKPLGLTITPQMRQSILRGQSAFADGGDVEGDGITAYHGSPHDFEKFDTSKIGTGEGAQAFGHGLYFAESEPVAEGYRDRLSGHHPGNVKIGDETHPHWAKKDVARAFAKLGYDPHTSVIAAHYIDEHQGNLEKASGALWQNENVPDSVHEALLKAEYSKPAGHMYEVHIKAHPDHFLDWEKPLSSQSQHVKDALAKLGVVSNDEQARAHHDALERALTDPNFTGDLPPAPPDPYGHKIYTTLRDQLRLAQKSKNVLSFKKSDVDTAQQLSKVGIRGIRYLDAGSRDEGEGTHNYVVFDHNHVAVKRKYAEGGKVEEYPLRHHNDWEEAHDYEKTGGKLHYEKPDEYLDQVKPLDMDHDDKHLIHHFEKQMTKGEKLDPVAIYPDGHPNGRHRAHAAKNLGIKKIPVVDWEKKKGGGPIVSRAIMVVSKKV